MIQLLKGQDFSVVLFHNFNLSPYSKYDLVTKSWLRSLLFLNGIQNTVLVHLREIHLLVSESTRMGRGEGEGGVSILSLGLLWNNTFHEITSYSTIFIQHSSVISGEECLNQHYRIVISWNVLFHSSPRERGGGGSVSLFLGLLCKSFHEITSYAIMLI
jgi:hypothetical protein